MKEQPVIVLSRLRSLLLIAAIVMAGLALGLLSDLTVGAESGADAITVYDAKAVERRPFDRGVFTQGFVIHSDKLWVSSGLYGKSFIERWNWPAWKLGEDGATHKTRLELPEKVFAEGLAVHKNTVFLLSWKSQKMFAIDPKRLEITHTYALPGEGWGVTSDGQSLWISDGTSRLREWRDGTFQKQLTVTLNGKPLPRLNELEWINGEIWANVWLTDQIVVISPATGRITRIIDLTNLLPKKERRRDTDVLNGIAHDPKTGDVWVTGKRWPTMFRIELVERR